MGLRDRTEGMLVTAGWPRYAAWAIVPLACAGVPGVGAFAAFIYLVALLKVGRQPFNVMGTLRQPVSWRWIALALVMAVGIELAANVALEPLARWVAAQPVDMSAFGGFEGNWGKLALFLALSWVSGGLIEETVFRGFIIGFGQRVFGARWRWPLALLSALIFGLSHLYQGTAGVVLTGITGLLLGAIYLLAGNNLLLVMVVHGLVDTISMLMLFLGLAGTN